jgi:hypothetical protein
VSNYTQSTNFATKDSLPSGDPLKIVKGTEINTEFVNISVAIATKLDATAGTISGATINNSTIGATTPSTGAFTTLSASGTTALSGTTTLSGATTLSGVTTINDAQRPVIDNIKLGYATTATAAGTTTLTVASPHQQFFTGSTTQTIVLPVTSTLALGLGYTITNNSSGVLTVQSSGLNDIVSVPAKATVKVVCILISGTTAASWSYVFEGSSNIPFSELNSISASIAANALTVTLNPCTIDFRSSTLTSGARLTRSVPTAITLTVSSGSTLGTTSGVESRLAVVAIDNAGTVELAIVNSKVYGALYEEVLISTTAEGGSGGADSGSVFYSTSARTSVAFRVIGFITSTQSTAGTWASTPSNVSGNSVIDPGFITTIVPSSFDAIGSILTVANYSTSNLVPSNTIAGSSLLYVTAFTNTDQNIVLEGSIASGINVRSQGTTGTILGNRVGDTGIFQPSNTATLSGTWRVLTPSPARSSVYDSGTSYTNIVYSGALVQRVL